MLVIITVPVETMFNSKLFFCWRSHEIKTERGCYCGAASPDEDVYPSAEWAASTPTGCCSGWWRSVLPFHVSSFCWTPYSIWQVGWWTWVCLSLPGCLSCCGECQDEEDTLLSFRTPEPGSQVGKIAIYHVSVKVSNWTCWQGWRWGRQGPLSFLVLDQLWGAVGWPPVKDRTWGRT